MRNIKFSVLIALILIALIATPVIAATYYARVQIQETNGTDYDMLPLIFDIDNDYLATNGYIEADALDTRIQTGSASVQPHLVADDKVAFAYPINGTSTTNLYYTFGNTDLASFPIVLGYEGYFTIPDAAGIELGNNFEVEFDGYVDTTDVGGKLFYKPTAIDANISAAGEITAGLITTDYTLSAQDQFDSTDGDYAEICQVSDDTVVVVYMDGDAGWDVMVCAGTVDGTGVTWGTEETIISDGYLGAMSTLGICAIDTNKFAVSFIDDTDDDGYVIAGTVSGTTITLGSAVEFSGNGDAEYISICKLDTDKFAVAYNDEDIGDDLYTVVCTVSGTTITNGAETEVTTDSAASHETKCIQLDTNKYIVCYDTKYYIITVSGTTPTVAASGTFTNIDEDGDAESISIGTTAYFVYTYDTGGAPPDDDYIVICSVTGTTVTEGTPLALNSSDLEYPSVGVIGDYILATYQDSGTNDLYATLFRYEGTTLTVLFEDQELYAGTITDTATCEGSDGLAVVAFNESEGLSYVLDFNNPVYAKSVTATGLTAGEMVVNVAADGTDLTIDIDSIEEDSVALAGSSVTDNTNDWYVMSNALPYIEYFEITVSGTLQADYDPIDIIAGDTLLDEENANDATIVWGTNPDGISITLGSLTSYSQPTPTGGAGLDTSVPDIVGDTGGVDWVDEDTAGLTTHPFYPIVSIVHDLTDFSEQQIWIMMAMFTATATMLLMFFYVPHQAFTAVAGGAWWAYFWGMGIFPFWTLFIFVLIAVALIMWERVPSV